VIIRSVKISRMAKIGGASLIGFCAVSLSADKVMNLTPMVSQLAGFVGAFLGSIAAQRRRTSPSMKQTAEPELPKK
jgi:hypothetical protein